MSYLIIKIELKSLMSSPPAKQSVINNNPWHNIVFFSELNKANIHLQMDNILQ